ncbi:serine/threonine protein kinase [Sphingomonas sp. QA11]|uniref:serine/threonine-protein kinase n=1 Tax=Sphingomonas sp. QA11 TaxID=2950605 RepID=UPI002349AF81|nr:serine/threonine-protein kinase [Sphingomonas sp. QA11]WCM25883.1 serine/threonine protein kinase [Sphingomonas sp. QA11]
MTDIGGSEIERRVLQIMEELADDPDDADLRARLLAGEDPAVVDRVRRIIGMASLSDAMPTEWPEGLAVMFADPPERFGAFRFVAPLGSGGMGEVWRGERCDGLFDQTVAIKLIQSHLRVRAGEAFEAERRILARFEHPNIARLIDGGNTDDGRACLVMEYVDGEPLDAACASLPLAGRIALFRQMLGAVAYAHGRLVAHGDLKPGNILVDRDGRARLLDFGIARLLTDEAGAVLLSGVVTSGYASPARLAGAPPSIADDVFALGRLLEVSAGDAQGRELAAIARKATALDEEDRYASVPDLSADLDRWSRDEPLAAIPRTWLYVARKFVRRRWKGLLVSAALLGVLGYAGWSYQAAERERIEASARFDDARGTARYLLFTLYDELVAHPRTLKLRRQVAGVAQRYLDRLAGSRSTVPEVKLEAAQGLLRLANVQGSPGMASLGDGKASRRNIDTAIALLQARNDPAARAILFDALLDSAFLAQNGESDEMRAARDLASAKTMLTDGSALSNYRKSRYYLAQSSVDRWASHNDLAIRDADQAIALLRASDDFDTLKLRSKVFERKADALYYLHRHKEAMASYRAAVVPLELALARFPANIEVRRRLAHIRWNLATALMDYGDPHEALALLDSAVAEIRVVLAFEPDDDDAQRRLAMFEQSRGETLVILGQLDKGFAVMRSSADEYRWAWQRNPKDMRSLRNYAVTLGNLADEQGKHGRFGDACANWRTYLRLYDLIEKSGHLAEEDRTEGISPARKNVQQHCLSG